MEDIKENIYKALKDVFGYNEFRLNQEKIITSVMQSHDTLAETALPK